jgi:hypothetical protein
MANMTDYDVEAVAFKAWLERRAKQGKRNAIDSLARRLSAETRIPRKASLGMYRAQLKAKGYAPEEIATFEQAWQEMRDQERVDEHATQEIIETP